MGVGKATAGRVGNRPRVLVAGTDAATGATLVLQFKLQPAAVLLTQLWTFNCTEHVNTAICKSGFSKPCNDESRQNASVCFAVFVCRTDLHVIRNDLTPWSRICLEKLVQNFPTCCGTQRFSTAFFFALCLPCILISLNNYIVIPNGLVNIEVNVTLNP